MTRILYWNINNFSRGKVWNDTDDNTWAESLDRLDHIVREVMGGHVPHIFVVVEVYSRTREVGLEGTAINTHGNVGLGLDVLLGEIRTAHGNHWCMVPPLNVGALGMREAVAVFYDSTQLQFVGPWVLANVQGLPWSQPPNGTTTGALTNYAADWRDAMPNPTNPLPALQQDRQHAMTWPGGGPVNVPEYQSAGQWAYYTAATAVPFPIPPANANRLFFPWYENRGPFRTDFIDLSPGGHGRRIKLFSVHTSPGTAVAAVNQLALVPELPPAANEVSVMVGDFNVDTFDMTENGAYTGLDGIYTMALDPRNGVGPPVPARKPYCMTHMLPTAHATPFNTTGVFPDPTHNVYPRYGYMGSMGGINFQTPVNTGAIDNVFTAYGVGAGGPAAANISIVNTVIGKPYNAVAPPAGVTAELTGGLAYADTLANDLPAPSLAVPGGGVDPPVDTINFPDWGNFGRIRSTSDHLALIIDV
jgi:hypothetical protein